VRCVAWLLWALCLAATLTACERRQPETAATPPTANANDANALHLLAGSELKELAPALQAAAAQAGVRLQLEYAGMLDMVERVNAGEAVDAILPAGSAYARLALEKPPLALEKLFYSRVTLGVKAAKLAELGWDKQPPTWADVAQAAGAGKLRYAMSSPTSSNTGMSALFAVASAGAGKTEDLKAEEVDAKLLKAFLAGQALTAGSSGWLAEAYARQPAALDAMVNYEAVLLRLNATLPPEHQLRLIYPSDGVISADYPLILLAEAKRQAWQRLVDVLKAKPFQQDALAAAFLRPANPDATAAPALPSQAVAELSFPNRLAVVDAVLSSYLAQWRKPATSIFVLDVSGSMRGERMEAMRQAIQVLGGADASRASSRYASFQQRERVVFIAFASQVQAPQRVSFETDVPGARAQVQALAAGLQPLDGTAVFSALRAAQDLAQEELAREPGRVVSIALLTDGESNQGLRFEQWREQAQVPGVRIFPVLFGEGNGAQMQAIAELSGGRVFDGRKAVLTAVFKEIRGYQ
jgi:Ca-activated chloride channel family protein